MELNYKRSLPGMIITRLMNTLKQEHTPSHLKAWLKLGISMLAALRPILDPKPIYFSITDLGEIGWKSFENAFCGCENLTTIKGGDTYNVTNMKQMFWGSYNAEPNVKDWDTSKVTNMSHIFDGVMFVNLDVSDWDTSSVTDMSGMFSNTSASVDLRNWDASKVTTMEDMFIAANANSNVSGLDTDKVINMRQMFYLSAVNPVMKDWNLQRLRTCHKC